ncbi:hypothetical protein [Undibacterium luofuense]|uniref:hypothetical protein n=1 Tax=Undibacterium luofuense TaxID=2828733 RepID=UPI0030EF6F52
MAAMVFCSEAAIGAAQYAGFDAETDDSDTKRSKFLRCSILAVMRNACYSFGLYVLRTFPWTVTVAPDRIVNKGKLSALSLLLAVSKSSVPIFCSQITFFLRSSAER